MPPATHGKKYFTATQANAMLPLVRRIVADITELARDMDRPDADPADGRARLRELARELFDLGVELKDPYEGLVDFPCLKDGREVCLCWKQGEPAVDHWHETDAGFAGRRPLKASES